MRADRLLLLLTLLQERGRMTTDQLADELEVCRRTVIRDLYALRVAGFPVDTERGPHGGCSLDDDFRNRLLRLSRNELSALFMTSVPAPLVELGVAADLKGALRKLSAALPAAHSDAERRVKQRIHLDSVPWSTPQESLQCLSTLHQAVLEDRWVQVTFERVDRIQSARRIAPHGLVAKAATWYVVWAGEDGRLRVDRVARVLEAELERGTFTRPEDFDLSGFWNAWCRNQEASGPHLLVTVRVSSAALDDLQSSSAVSIEVAGEGAGPRDVLRPHCVRMRFASVEEARSRLLAYGGSVEVLEPLALRLTLADFAEQAVRVYEARGAARSEQ